MCTSARPRSPTRTASAAAAAASAAAQPSAMGKCTIKLSDKVQGFFYRSYYAWGTYTSRRPLLVILVSFGVALACMTRIWIVLLTGGQLPQEIEPNDLWVPPRSRAKIDQARYEVAFGHGYRRSEIYFTTTPKGGNVLTAKTFEEILRFDRLVKYNLSATAYRPKDDFEPLELANPSYYPNVCAAIGRSYDADALGVGDCIQFENPLDLLYYDGTYNFDLTDEQILELINTGRGIDPILWPEGTAKRFNVNATFGGLEYDEDGYIIAAKAVRVVYSTMDADSGEDIEVASAAFEDQLNYMIGPEWTLSPPISVGSAWDDADGPGEIQFRSDVVTLYPQTTDANAVQMRRTIYGDVNALAVGISLIICYAVFVLARCHPVRSQALLALTGVATCCLAIGISYGLTTAFGVKVNPVVHFLPFVLIGIGIDDMFVLVNAFDRSDRTRSVAERMGQTLGSAGVSITVTSLTDLFAFVLGATSSLPALRDFCIFAAVGVTSDFVLQITFFAGFMVLDARRQHNNRIDGLPCIQRDPQEDKVACCCFPSCGRCFAAPEEGRLRSFIRRFYLPALNPTWVRAGLVLMFLGWFGASAYFASKLEQDFQDRWFVPSDDELQDTFAIQDEWFSNQGLPVWVVTPDTDEYEYSPVADQQAVERLGLEVEANEWILIGSVTAIQTLYAEWVWECGQTIATANTTCTSSPTPECVTRHCADANGTLCYPHCTFGKIQRMADGTPLRDAEGQYIYGAELHKYVVDANGDALPDGEPRPGSYVPPDHFWEWIDQFVSDEPRGQAIASYIAWKSGAYVRSPEDVAEGVLGMRMRAVYKDVQKVTQEVEAMQSLRQTVDSVKIGPPGSTYPFMYPYLFSEQYAVIVREAVINLSLALCAVFLITFCVMGDLTATLLVMLCVLMVDVDILGLMYLWGVSIHSISIINLVLAIGLSVDYSAHVAHAFVIAQGTPMERMNLAVTDMGTAVIHGATSTLLAVLVLSGANSYVFRTFFQQFFGICVFGLTHGIVFLPCMLTFVPPPPGYPANIPGATDTDGRQAHRRPKSPPPTPASVPLTPGVEVAGVYDVPTSDTTCGGSTSSTVDADGLPSGEHP